MTVIEDVPAQLGTGETPVLRRSLSVVRWCRHLILPAILIAFIIQGLRIVPGYRGQMNPDGVGYLTIARQILQGHFADSVNAYWSPLYSWLLVPLMAAGVESLMATKVLAVLIGAEILAAVWWLLRNLGVATESRVIVSLTLFPILYYFGMDVTTPDLLITGMLLLYVAQMTSPRWGRRRWDGALAGVLAGLAYLAKAYALPVVGVHFVLVSTVAWLTRRKQKRRRVLIHTFVGLLTFGAIVGAWGGILRHKYGHFTTGSTGKFNIAFNGPKFEQPTHTGILLPPPTETGTSGWDDATVLPYVKWNPLATPEDRAFWEKNRTRNEADILKFMEKFTWLLWPIAIAGISLASSRLDRKPRRPGAIFVTLVVIYPIGYWLLHAYERFLSLLCIGLLVTGAFAVARLTWPLNRWVRVPLRVVCVVLVAWSFLSTPGWRYGRDPWATALDRWSIAGRWAEETGSQRRATALAGLMPPRAKMASVGDWSSPLYVGYLLNLRYYGEAMGGEGDVRAQLAKYQIEYLWVSGVWRSPFLRDLKEITGGKVQGVRIYDLRPPTTQPTTRP